LLHAHYPYKTVTEHDERQIVSVNAFYYTDIGNIDWMIGGDAKPYALGRKENSRGDLLRYASPVEKPVKEPINSQCIEGT
jgi:hypothetical protein